MEKQSTHKLSNLDTYILENTPQRTRDRYHGLAEYAQTHDFGVLDEDVVVIDTETTGFSFNHDELIQIAAARMAHGKIVEWYITFVNPGKQIPEDVAHLTNISDSDVADAPNPDEALRGLVEFVGDSDLVAHNANFDRTFVTKREAGESLKQNRWIDSLDLARIALPRFTSHRLLDLVRAFGGPDSTHRADDDVAATCLVYRILLAAVATLPQPLICAIGDMNEVEEWNTAYVFRQLADPQVWEELKGKAYKLRLHRKESLTKNLAPMRPDANSPASGICSEVNYGISAAESRGHTRVAEGTEGTESVEATEAIEGTESAAEEIAPRVLSFVDKKVISDAFSPEGLLGSLYKDYETRDEQKWLLLYMKHCRSRAT